MHQLLARLSIARVITGVTAGVIATTPLFVLPSYALDVSPQQPADATKNCPVPTTFSAPSRENRTIELEDWQIIFSMPANYRTHRTASTVQIFSPEGYDHLQCLLPETTAHIDPINSNALSSISISSVTGNLTEEDILSWAEEESGELLGTTKMANGYQAFVHTRNSPQASAMVLSLPTGEGITFVLSTPLNELGDVLHPDAFHMVAGTFMFHLGWYDPLERAAQNKQAQNKQVISSTQKQESMEAVSAKALEEKV